MPFSKFAIYTFILFACSNCHDRPVKPEPPQAMQDTTSTKPSTIDTSTRTPHDPNVTGPDTPLLNAAMEKIFKLPEVQEIDSIIRQSTQGKHGVAMMVNDGWNQDSSYYRIIVGNNTHEDRYETIYNFVLDKQTGDIKIFDALADSILSITDWRKTRL